MSQDPNRSGGNSTGRIVIGAIIVAVIAVLLWVLLGGGPEPVEEVEIDEPEATDSDSALAETADEVEDAPTGESFDNRIEDAATEPGTAIDEAAESSAEPVEEAMEDSIDPVDDSDIAAPEDDPTAPEGDPQN
ncbi:hypothetical protein [Histidinibacterium aquaticum]|uniref:Uncharacterized protein n=1 Tax=Histidinibacterium aquaticum TaxID=2613962 RepID=A0A5J5GM14_9RHOB|nr:hypothetical protein [Histidinibacterium aquaticum]KAA9009331.1 hypothetical protein F3S47_08785 [Histidinibacterium aquaticum]